MASEELMRISRDEAERMRLLSEEKYILDNQSRRAEGIKIGRKESEAEIAQKDAEIAEKNSEIAKKDAESTKKDIEIAEKNSEIAQKDAKITQIQKETARNLKAASVSLDIISQSTGLSLEEIEEL